MAAIPIRARAERAIAIATRIDRMCETLTTQIVTVPTLAAWLAELATLGIEAQAIATEAAAAGVQNALDDAIAREIVFDAAALDAVTILATALGAGQAASNALHTLPDWQAPAVVVTGGPGAWVRTVQEVTLPTDALDALAALRAAAAPLVRAG